MGRKKKEETIIGAVDHIQEVKVAGKRVTKPRKKKEVERVDSPEAENKVSTSILVASASGDIQSALEIQSETHTKKPRMCFTCNKPYDEHRFCKYCYAYEEDGIYVVNL